MAKYYPWFSDKNFTNGVLEKREFHELNEGCCLKNYQQFIANYINPVSVYWNVLLYMSTGTGKTLASVAIAENFIKHKGMKCIVITKNKDLIFNFIKEILFTCSRYTTPEEVSDFYTSSVAEKKVVISKYIKRLEDFYIFSTYDKIKKEHNDGKLLDFNNHVVIVDEIQNIIGNSYYPSFHSILTNSVDYRLVLLSATPIFDKVIEIVQLNNLLNCQRKDLQITNDNLNTFFKKSKNTISAQKDGLFADDKIINAITSEGENFMRKNLKSKIILVKPDVKSYPRIIYAGREIGELQTAVVDCEMLSEGVQETGYNLILEDRAVFRDFDKTLQYAMDMVFPNVVFRNGVSKSSIGKFGVDYFIKGAKVKDIDPKQQVKLQDIFHISKINAYSSKLYLIIKNIKSSYTKPRKICVYTHDVAYNGAILLKKLFHYNDIKSYRIITSDISEDKRKSLLLQFNSQENDNGSQIKILVFSRILAEGITFKSARELHIFDSAWNFSTLDQVVGRVARTNSHASLPLSQRDVTIYRYCATLPDPGGLHSSIDYSKYLKSERKDIQIKRMERILMTSSFACNRMRPINADYFNEYTNGSRECQYTKCDYACDEKGPEKITDDTYNIVYHSPELFGKIREWVLGWDTGASFRLVDLQKQFNISKRDVRDAMHRITEDSDDVIVIDNDYVKNLTKVAETIRNNYSDYTSFTMDSDTRIKRTPDSKAKICTNFTKAELFDFLFSVVPRTPELDRLKKKEICDMLISKLL